MAPRIVTRALILGGIAAAAVLAAVATQGTLQAQETESSGIVVGTYAPGDVAQHTGLQQRMQEGIEDLQQRMQLAQQAGNQQEMREIQAEAQQLQQDIVADFESSVDAAMADVAKAADVDIIAIEVSYAAPGIETKDVTQEIIGQLNGGDSQSTPER